MRDNLKLAPRRALAALYIATQRQHKSNVRRSSVGLKARSASEVPRSTTARPVRGTFMMLRKIPESLPSLLGDKTTTVERRKCTAISPISRPSVTAQDNGTTQSFAIALIMDVSWAHGNLSAD